MNHEHVAVAVLAGRFESGADVGAKRFDRLPDGRVVFEFSIKTDEGYAASSSPTRHPIIAYGPTAIRIATTCSPGDLVVVSGDVGVIPGHRLPTALMNAKNVLRVTEGAPRGIAASLNLACVIGSALHAVETRLRDGTPVTLLTLACAPAGAIPSVTNYAAILVGSTQELATNIATGDTIRVDGPIDLYPIGGEDVWAVGCVALKVLKAFPVRRHLLPAMDSSLRRTA